MFNNYLRDTGFIELIKSNAVIITDLLIGFFRNFRLGFDELPLSGYGKELNIQIKKTDSWDM